MATDPRAGRYARLACKTHALVPVSEGVQAPAAPLSPLQAKLRNYRRTIEKRSAQRLHNSAYSRPNTSERAPRKTPRRVDVDEQARSPTPPPQELIALARVGSPRLCQRPTAQRRHPDISTPEIDIGQVPSSSSSAPPPRYSAGTRLAIMEWAGAVTARFGTEDRVRSCAKWLALSCNTKGGALHNLTDLQAACRDLGMAANDVSVVAASLWEGLSVLSHGKETLPASILLEILVESDTLAEAQPAEDQRFSLPQVHMDRTPRSTGNAAKDGEEESLQPRTPPRDGKREGADARWRARLLHPADRTPLFASTPPPLATSPPPAESPALNKDEAVGKPSKPSGSKKQSTKEAADLETPVKGGAARPASRQKRTPSSGKAKEGVDVTPTREVQTAMVRQTPLARRLRKATIGKLEDAEDDDATPKATLSVKPPKRRTYLTPGSLVSDGRQQAGRTSRSPSIAPSIRSSPRSRRTVQAEEEEESPKGAVDAEVRELFHNLFQVTHDKVVEQETQEKELQGPTPEAQSPGRRKSVVHRRSRVGREGMSATPEALRRTNRRAQSATVSPLEPPPLDRGVSRGRKRRGSVDHRYDLLTRVQTDDRRGSLIPGLRARLEKEKQMGRTQSDDLGLRSRDGRSPRRSASKLSTMRASAVEGVGHATCHHRMEESHVSSRSGSKGSARAELMRRKEKAKQQVQAAKETKHLQRVRRATTTDLMPMQLRQDLAALTIQALARGVFARSKVQEFLFQGLWADEENSPGWRFQVVVLPAEFKKERGLSRVKFTVLQAPLEYMEFQDRSVLLYLRGKWQAALNTYVGEGLYAEHRMLEDVLQLAGSHFTFVFRNNTCSCTDHYGYTYVMKAQRTDPARDTPQDWHGFQHKVGNAGSLLKVTVKQWRGEAATMTRTISANVGGGRAMLRQPDFATQVHSASPTLGETAERHFPAVEKPSEIRKGALSCELATPLRASSDAHDGKIDGEEDALSVATVSPRTAEEEDSLLGKLTLADGAHEAAVILADKDGCDRRSSFESNETDPAALPKQSESHANPDGHCRSSSASFGSSSADVQQRQQSQEQVLWIQERAAGIVSRAALSVAMAAVLSGKAAGQVVAQAAGVQPQEASQESPMDQDGNTEQAMQVGLESSATASQAGGSMTVAEASAASGSGDPEVAVPCDGMQQPPGPVTAPVLPVTARPQPAATAPKPPPLPPLGPPNPRSNAYITVPMETVLAASSAARNSAAVPQPPPTTEGQHPVEAIALAPIVPQSLADGLQGTQGQHVSMDTLLQAVRSARQAQENQSRGEAVQVRSGSAMSSTGTGDTSTSGTLSTQRSKTDWLWAGSAPIRTGGSALLSAARTLFRSSISAR
mmetsp:Transcript_16867/g.39197  ORF Transcript_16867/g.39197 Transcript_16867/m.39197 type:complete len:1358 (+) Transcript_16867:31-4104(+)